jgi:hypothetical protein
MGGGRGGIYAVSLLTGSVIQRAGNLLWKTLWGRLLLWAAGLTCAPVLVKVLAPDGVGLPPAVDQSVLVLTGCLGLTAAVYFLIRFAVSWELTHLLSAAAFAAITSGVELQALAGSRGYARNMESWLLTSAMLIASVLFAGAGFARTITPPPNRIHGRMRLALATLLCLAFPTVALPYALNTNILISLSSLAGNGLSARAACLGCDLVIVLLLLSAIVGHCRKSGSSMDRVFAVMCYFLVTCAIAMTFKALAVEENDLFLTAGQLVFLASWPVLILGFGVESALGQGEVQDRLREFEAMHQISWSIVGAGSLRDLLDLFAGTLRDRLGAKIVCVYIAQDGGETLKVAAARGPEDAQPEIGAEYRVLSTDRRPGFHTGHTAKALLTKQAQTARDVFVDVELAPWQVVAVDDGCAVSLPLAAHDAAIGVLSLYFSDYRQLTQHRMRLLQTIAAAVTPAIRDSMARDDTQAHESTLDELDMAA